MPSGAGARSFGGTCHVHPPKGLGVCPCGFPLGGARHSPFVRTVWLAILCPGGPHRKARRWVTRSWEGDPLAGGAGAPERGELSVGIESFATEGL